MSVRDEFEKWASENWIDGLPKMIALRAWQASRAAALEEAAKASYDIAVDRWNLYKGRGPYSGSEPNRADPYTEGQSDGAEMCADAIRALAKSEGESNGRP